MILDPAALSSSLAADLARDFSWATQDEIERAVQAAVSALGEARVTTFLPILAQREARRALAAIAARRSEIVLPDVVQTAPAGV